MGKRKQEKYNWTKVRNEYIQGYMSIRELCIEHNIPYNTMVKKAGVDKEHWTKQRNEYRKMFTQKTLENSAEREARAVQEMKEKERGHIALLEKAAIEKLIVIDDNTGKSIINHNMTAQDVNAISSVFEKCQKMRYKSFGISDNINVKADVFKKEVKEIRILSDDTIAESIAILGKAGVLKLPAETNGVH